MLFERCKRGNEAGIACLAVGSMVPSAFFEFSAMNDAQVDGELARDPAKMFIGVGKESVESEFAHVIERMERQFQQPFCAIRSW